MGVRVLILFSLILLVLKGSAQDTARVMHYNLLYFGSTYGCTEGQNSTTAKQGYLRIITQYAKPDIITVNELCDSPGFADGILNNSLNVFGTNSWQRATMMNLSGTPSPIVNMLFYNSNKFVLYNQEIVEDDLGGSELVRATDMYTLYYNDPGLATGNDTLFFTVSTMHLHSSDASQRLDQTASYMDHLENNYGPGNHLVTGDFNIDGSSESSFQKLINYSNSAMNFYDPLNQLGWWHIASAFSAIHTQSTRLSNTNSGCFASGGMDDRFDFLLASNDAMNGNQGMWYVPGSYAALGQDGTFFDQEMPQTGNGMVPDSVSISLYGLSDHLPVYADFLVGPNVTTVAENMGSANQFIVSTVNSGELHIRALATETITLSVISISGQTVIEQTLSFTVGELKAIKASAISEGFYLVVLAGESLMETHKVLVVK